MTDNTIEELNKTLEKEYKTNNGTITLTIVPKTVSPNEEGKVNVAEVILSMTGDIGTNPIDGVEEMLQGLFKSTAGVSKDPNFHNADVQENLNRENIREQLEEELQTIFPKIHEPIYHLSLYTHTDADRNEPYENVGNGKSYSIGKLVKEVGRNAGGNKHKKKSNRKRVKTQKKRSKRQIRKTKGKKNANQYTKNKIVKNGKKK